MGERTSMRTGMRSAIETEPRDRLQPALLDRLIRDEGEAARILSKSELRQAVLRDLAWLFNAVQPLPQWNEERPAIAGTVLNYGLPPLAGRQLSKLDITRLERTIAEAIKRFEPRILADTLSVHAVEASSVLETHNMIEFEIRGQLWAQPVPLEILLRTQMDLEAGQVEVHEAGAGLSAAQAR
jgi:type VI secretion system protein ImpF